MICRCVSITEAEECVEQFQCEDAPDVERYLKQQAVMHHQQNTAHTRLFFDDAGEVIGFFTVYVGQVVIGKGKRRDKGWELDAQYTIFPAIRLHYVAVDGRYRNLGYGKAIVNYAVEWCRWISGRAGCNFITIEAKAERVSFFEQFGFDYCSRKRQSCLTVDGRHLHMCLYLGNMTSVMITA
jgi:GNAT superfamily N-acetyltransferase